MLFSDPAIPSITRTFSGSQFPSKLTASFVEVTSVVLGLETARDRGQLSSLSREVLTIMFAHCVLCQGWPGSR